MVQRELGTDVIFKEKEIENPRDQFVRAKRFIFHFNVIEKEKQQLDDKEAVNCHVNS